MPGIFGLKLLEPRPIERKTAKAIIWRLRN